jgi:outer membrane protein OmpA-like peptidoglycan-associated protein
MKALRLTILFLLGFALIAAVCALVEAPRIERELTITSCQALDREGIDVETVVFDGRDGVLAGKVDAPVLKRRATQTVLSVWGVRRLRNDLGISEKEIQNTPVKPIEETVVAITPVEPASTPAPTVPASQEEKENEPLPLSGPVLGIEIFPEKFRISGEVKTQENLEQLKAIANRVNPERKVETGNIQLNEDREDLAAYAPVLDALVAMDIRVKRGIIIVICRSVIIAGTVASEGIKESISAEARIKIPQDFRFYNWLSVDETPSPVQESLDKLLIGKTVEFDHNSDQLTRAGASLLGEIAETLKRFPQTLIEIRGHTDWHGEDAFNLDLSRRRAATVKRSLTAKGISESLLNVSGYGESRPIADNRTAAGRARNRRVEFIVLRNERKEET